MCENLEGGCVLQFISPLLDCAVIVCWVEGGQKSQRRAKKQETQGAGGCSGLPVGIPPTPACTKVWTESPPVQDIQTRTDFKARMDAPWVDSKNMARYSAGKNRGYCSVDRQTCV